MTRASLWRIERDERGMTLTELLVTMALLGVVTVIFTSVLASVQNVEAREANRSESNDQARQAVDQINRQVRSGNLFYDPASEATLAGLPSTSAGYAFRVYTQALSQSVNPNGARCVQWRLLDQQLQTRSWTTTWQQDDVVTPWRTVADHVVNSGASQKPFVLGASSNAFLQVLEINILVNNSPGRQNNVQLNDAVTGRNTNQGFPENLCGQDSSTIPDP